MVGAVTEPRDMALDGLRQALQALLDAEGDGWHVSHYIVVLGIERMDADSGRVDSGVWTAAPVDQADYVATGLLETAQIYRNMTADADDD